MEPPVIPTTGPGRYISYKPDDLSLICGSKVEGKNIPESCPLTPTHAPCMAGLQWAWDKRGRKGNYKSIWRRKETLHPGIWLGFPSNRHETLDLTAKAKIAYQDNCLMGGLPWCMCGGQIPESVFFWIYIRLKMSKATNKLYLLLRGKMIYDLDFFTFPFHYCTVMK